MSENDDSCWWDFGDGTISSEINPVHAYDTTGSYGASTAVENNIFSGFVYGAIFYDGNDDGHELTYDYNVYYNNSTYDLAENDGAVKELTIGSNSMSADPQLNNPGSEDATLKASSPCIDAGLDLGDTYDEDMDGWDPDSDGLWDIGAFQFKKAGGF